MTLTTSNTTQIVGEYRPDLILEPLLGSAVAFNSAVSTIHNIPEGNKGARIPIVREDAVAAWTEEGEEISPTDVDLDELLVEPSKVAGLIPVTSELARDSSPAAAAIVGRSLARSVAFQIDAAFFGDLAAPAPAGLASLEAPVVVGGPLTNLDPLLEAKSAIAVNGGNATAVLAHPTDALALGKLKDTADSNRALLADLRTVADLPLIQSQHIEAGTVWVVDSSSVHVGLREDIEVETSAHALFSSDRIAIRATARAGFGFPYPNRIAKIVTP